VAEWPEFDPEPQLRALQRRRVDFVVVGAIAAVLHGSSRLTTDLDIAFAPERENLEALGEALADLEARLRGVEDDVPFVPDLNTLRRVDLLTLDTVAGPLDVMRRPLGAPTYKVLKRRAERVDLGGFEVLTASIEDLIAMKRASARTKDLADAEELEAILRLRSE
jgi:predicted nucleotidyltransferase